MMGLTFDEIDNLTLSEYNKLVIKELYIESQKQYNKRDLEYAIYNAQGAGIKKKSDLYPIPLIDNAMEVMPIRTRDKAIKLIERVLKNHKVST